MTLSSHRGVAKRRAARREPRAPARSRRGFTLIETALALFAIGLGLLALFGLGHIGLDSSRETENERRCQRLADTVFETLRAYNDRFVAEARTNHVPNAWALAWMTVRTVPEQIPFPPVANMSVSENLYLSFVSENRNPPLPDPAYDTDALSLQDWNPRYRLYLYSDESGRADQLHVLLEIFPDGDTCSSEPRLFHTTLSDPGELP